MAHLSIYLDRWRAAVYLASLHTVTVLMARVIGMHAVDTVAALSSTITQLNNGNGKH
jgi:hypothetical protein